MSLSLFLQQCPACFVRRTWIVLEMGSKWPALQLFCRVLLSGFFKIASCILVQILSSFFSIRFVSVREIRK